VEKIKRAVLITDEVVEEITNDLRRTLLEADVNVKLTMELIERIKKRSRGEIPKGMSKKEYLIKILYDELVAILGEGVEITLEPKRILLVGLYGSGKTSFAAKLARYYQRRNLNVGLVCCDTTREAAYDQLKQLASQIHVAFYGERENKNSAEIAKNALQKFRDKDIIIFDSSGRNALDESLIEEIKNMNEIVKPKEIILIIPADIGQAAYDQAKAFKEALNITSIVVTKLDATAKGGGALTACAATGAKISFLSVGEKVDDIELYNPQRFVSRLLGFGDIEGLLEKIKETDAPKIAEKILEEEFTIEDFIRQSQEVQKVGSFDKIFDMLGLGGKIPNELLTAQQEKMKRWKYIIDSMTKEERKNPEIINASRIQRIARGSGTSESDVRELLAAYKQTKKMMQAFKPGRLRGLKGMKDIMKMLRGFKF
jgi:signal recognition particle subunit SRP54